jgi:hypothetical protein
VPTSMRVVGVATGALALPHATMVRAIAQPVISLRCILASVDAGCNGAVTVRVQPRRRGIVGAAAYAMTDVSVSGNSTAQ